MEGGREKGRGRKREEREKKGERGEWSKREENGVKERDEKGVTGRGRITYLL